MGKNKIIKKEEKIDVKKINYLLKKLEAEIEFFANKEGLDSATGIADFRIAEICINAIKGNITQDNSNTEPYRETPIKIKQWLIDKKKKERSCL